MTVLVLTGATRGIGQAAAIELARRGVELVLVGRSPARVQDTARAAAAAGNAAPVHQHVADLAELDEVRRLAVELLDTYPRIDVLTNNAGALFTSRHETADGFEQTFALNHLSPFLLTNLLLDRLVGSRARVITTSSDAHKQGKLDIDDLNCEHAKYSAWQAYRASKLCNVLFTRELQRRAPALIANCFHPGVIRSGFGKNDGALARISMTLAGPFLSSPQKGGDLLAWLALDPAAGQLRGEYVEKRRPVPPSPQAVDDDLARELWERSARLTGLAVDH